MDLLRRGNSGVDEAVWGEALNGTGLHATYLRPQACLAEASAQGPSGAYKGNGDAEAWRMPIYCQARHKRGVCRLAWPRG